MVVGPCFAMRPRKIRERYLFFREEWPFQDERILINHHPKWSRMSQFQQASPVFDVTCWIFAVLAGTATGQNSCSFRQTASQDPWKSVFLPTQIRRTWRWSFERLPDRDPGSSHESSLVGTSTSTKTTDRTKSWFLLTSGFWGSFQ